MKKTATTQITFTQATGNKKVVKANRYVAYALYTQNQPIWEALGGVRVEGEKTLTIQFPTVAKAQAFISQAITSVSKKEYNATRKTEPKAKATKKATVPAPAKGKTETKLVTVTLADGTKLRVKESDLMPMDKTAKAKGKKPTTAPSTKAKATETKPTKAKGNTKTLTPEQAKMLKICKVSVLNRAASAYSIEHGGEPTNFDTLGKTEKELAKYLPKAKADMLKSSKWAKAQKMGLTEDMLGF